MRCLYNKHFHIILTVRLKEKYPLVSCFLKCSIITTTFESKKSSWLIFGRHFYAKWCRVQLRVKESHSCIVFRWNLTQFRSEGGWWEMGWDCSDLAQYSLRGKATYALSIFWDSNTSFLWHAANIFYASASSVSTVYKTSLLTALLCRLETMWGAAWPLNSDETLWNFWDAFPASEPAPAPATLGTEVLACEQPAFIPLCEPKMCHQKRCVIRFKCFVVSRWSFLSFFSLMVICSFVWWNPALSNSSASSA